MSLFWDASTVENVRRHTEFMRMKHIVQLPSGQGLPNTVKLTASGGAYGAIIGVWFAGMHRPINYKRAVRQMSFITTSTALLAGTFAATTSIAATYRGKDTPLNYFIGGVSAGAVFGTLSKNVPAGFGMAAVFGVTAAFAKFWVIEGFGPPFGKPEY